MNTRRIWNLFRILAAVLLIAVLVGLGWRVTLLREPAYQGKSLSVWLRQFEEAKFNGLTSRYHLSPMEFKAQFVEPTQNAVRHIGTNALPTLLNLVQAKDTPLSWRAMDLLERLHLGRWKPPPEIVRRSMALDGFIFLGAEGQPAVPALIELLNDKDGDVRSRAASCLGFIGPAAVEAVPALLQHLNEPDPSVCLNSETSLGLIHGRPELVIPALTERLRRKDKWHTLSALGWFGPDAKAAVPVILPLLNDQDQETRNRAAIVLKRIDPEAAASAEAKSP